MEFTFDVAALLSLVTLFAVMGCLLQVTELRRQLRENQRMEQERDQKMSEELNRLRKILSPQPKVYFPLIFYVNNAQFILKICVASASISV